VNTKWWRAVTIVPTLLFLEYIQAIEFCAKPVPEFSSNVWGIRENLPIKSEWVHYQVRVAPIRRKFLGYLPGVLILKLFVWLLEEVLFYYVIGTD
jgi:hypothetical protein